MTQWTITDDKLAEPGSLPGTNDNAAGVVGPRGAKLTHKEICEHSNRVRFRLYDDDNVICYEGFLVGDDEFAPLDQFGEPNAGCTRIDIMSPAGKWETL